MEFGVQAFRGGEEMRYWLPLSIFLAMSVFLWKGLDLNPKEIPSALVGHFAPHFHLPTVQDPNRFVTDQILMGKVTVLNIWTTNCIGCEKEHGLWKKLAQKHHLFLIGVNYHDDLTRAQQWLKIAGDPYAFCVFDEAGKLGLDYGVYGTPETFVIDKKGIIRYRHVGAIDASLWQSTLLPLIELLQR